MHENISDPDVLHPSNDSSITETRPRFQRYRTMIGRHKVELLLFVLLWTTYAYFYQSTQQNEAGRFDQIRAVVQDHTLAINKYWWNSADVIRYPAGDTGPIYPNKAPGTTLFGALPFAFWSLLLKVLTLFGVPQFVYWHLVTYLTIVFTVSLLSALAAVAVYRVLYYITNDSFFSLMAVLAVWLGTMAFPFSTLFFSHQLAAALLTSAFYLLFKVHSNADVVTRNAKAHLYGAGLLMGLSVATEYPTVLLAGLLCIYGFWIVAKQRGHLSSKALLLGALTLGLLTGVATLVVYNILVFGKPFFIPYEAYSTANAPFSSTYSHGWLGLRWRGWSSFQQALSAITLTAPIGLLYLGFEGWIIYARNPVLWLVIPGLVAMLCQRRVRAEGLLITAMIVAYLLFLTSYGQSAYDWAGASYLGPRHLIPLLPFLALPLYFGARYLKLLFYPLLAVSVFYMLIATATEPRVPYPFDNPGRDFLLPDYLRGRLAQNTDSLFDGVHEKITKDSTAFNLAKLARIPGQYQLLPLMLWWFLIGTALHSASLKRKTNDVSGDAVKQDLTQISAIPKGLSLKRAIFFLFLFVAVVGFIPPIHHAMSGIAGKRHGLLGLYYANANWTGTPVDRQIDPTVDFNWSQRYPLQPPFSVEWVGKLFIDKGETYTFALLADDGASLEIDGKMVVNAMEGPVLTRRTGTINLQSGRHPIRIRYWNALFGGSVKLTWSTVGRSEDVVPDAVLIPPDSRKP